jgi:hypothetical protein
VGSEACSAEASDRNCSHALVSEVWRTLPFRRERTRTIASARSAEQRPVPVQQRRTLAIVRMCSLLNYSEHCRLEASAREQSRVPALLNRPKVSRRGKPPVSVGNAVIR